VTVADILDELFPACALAAFVEQACIEQSWPDPEATRRLAFRLYEEALAEKNRRVAAPNIGSHPPLVPPEPAANSHD
jgi:hypothetical protein